MLCSMMCFTTMLFTKLMFVDIHLYSTNSTEEVMNRDLTSVGTFDVFVPAHVAPRMSAAMLKESLSRPKYYKLIYGNSMLHVSNCHILLIRRLILLFLVSIY